MLPVLESLADGCDHRLRELVIAVGDRFKLSDLERAEMLPSGTQTMMSNRVAWAKTYLKKAGLLLNPTRGFVRISDEGKRILGLKLAKIDNRFLRQYESFSAFENKTKLTEPDYDQMANPTTPEESLEAAHGILKEALAGDLLDKVKSCSPRFFEQLVVELLVAMGYGGSLADAGKAIGRSGDGGIDGIIKEDKLGLDVVCIQAKRWERTVGRPEVQAFAGSMEGFRAKKGVLVTTATFSREATDYIDRIERKIVLIDGPTLADLMIEYGLGVTVDRTYVVKKLDFDYFDSEE